VSPSWRDFATYLKHNRQEFSVIELIGSLDVEKMRELNTLMEKGVEYSSANIALKKNLYISNNNNNSKPKQTPLSRKSK
jgi:hypothetical protein